MAGNPILAVNGIILIFKFLSYNKQTILGLDFNSFNSYFFDSAPLLMPWFQYASEDGSVIPFVQIDHLHERLLKKDFKGSQV